MSPFLKLTSRHRKSPSFPHKYHAKWLIFHAAMLVFFLGALPVICFIQPSIDLATMNMMKKQFLPNTPIFFCCCHHGGIFFGGVVFFKDLCLGVRFPPQDNNFFNNFTLIRHSKMFILEKNKLPFLRGAATLNTYLLDNFPKTKRS